MKKSTKVILVVLAVIFFTAVFFYYKLGGFRDPEIKLAEAPAYVIAGKPYKGKMTSKEFGKLFEESENYLANKTLKGRSCGVFYNNPEKETDTIDAFVGILLDDETQKIPQGYTLKNIPARKIVRAHIEAHILVSPFIYPDIDDFAKEKNITLQHVPALEIYPSREEMIIEVPAK